MDETELIEFIFLLTAMAIVLQANFGYIWVQILPWVALLGAFYLVFGVLSRMAGFITGKAFARRDDWWNGLAILGVVVLFSGHDHLAVNAVKFFVRAIYTGIVAVAGLF